MGSVRDQKKKEHERFLLDRFLELQGISPARIEESESPDFIIDLEGRKVGIELTELFIRRRSKGQPQPAGKPLLQAVETTTNRIMSKAQSIYFDAGNPLVLAEIWFSDQVTFDKDKGDQIAKLIANQIQSMSLQNSQAGAWRSSEDESEERLLYESVDMIHAFGVPELRFARWTVAKPGMVAPLTPKHLQEAIDEKSEKFGFYKKNARTEEIWLLIVADATLPSRMFYLAPDLPRASVSSPFTKTFYCDFVHKEVIEIPNKAKTSGEK